MRNIVSPLDGIRSPFGRRLGAAPFSPASLFAASEPGGWYDPSDLSTLYQDAAGTTPVTAVEQPVGLVLDKSKPLGQTGNYSGIFDGTGDYVSTASSSALAFGTGDFTAELWALSFNVSGGSQKGVFQTSDISGGLKTTYTTGITLAYGGTATGNPLTGGVFANVGGVTIGSSTAYVTTNTWHHLALVRHSGVATLYVNGVAIGSATATGNLSGTYAAIGGYFSTSYLLDGYISNLRVVKGSAVYTSNFVAPSSPLTSITGTSLLTCQNTTFIDNSSNGITLIASGDAKTGRANPFGSHLSQSTAAARPVLRATSRIDYDGTDDKMTAASSGGGTTGFLFVAGINLDAIGATQTIWSDTGTNTGYRVRINSSNQLELAAGNGTAYTTAVTTETLSATTNYVIAAWHDGTNLNVKLGTGGAVASQAFAAASAGSAGFTIGMDNGSVSSQLNGKLYNVVYVKNFAGSLSDVTNTIAYVNGTLT